MHFCRYYQKNDTVYNVRMQTSYTKQTRSRCGSLDLSCTNCIAYSKCAQVTNSEKYHRFLKEQLKASQPNMCRQTLYVHVCSCSLSKPNANPTCVALCRLYWLCHIRLKRKMKRNKSTKLRIYAKLI